MFAPGPGGPILGFPPYPPAPARRAPKGLSTAAIVVIVVVVVAIATAVPAAVLYLLVSGLNTSITLGTPGVLGLSVNSTAGPSGNPPSYYVSVHLSPTAGLSTSEFGLEVLNATQRPQSLTGASVQCVQGAGAAGTACVAGGSGWYAVLLGSTGKVLGTYSLSSGLPVWTNLPAGAEEVTVSGLDSLLVVSSSSYASDGYVLEAFGTGSIAVTGEVTL